jgi:hypothetical protein
MRVNPVLPVAVLSFAAVLNAQSVEERLKWARETIDTHAVTHHFEPPSRSSGTKWQVTKIDGCTMELKQTDHRESPDTVFNGGSVYGFSEDKIVTWTFDLSGLAPEFITADTSTGLPQVRIFAEGDAFHLQTESVSRFLRKDGTTASTSTWSTPGSARNLWMYFDSPTIDNKPLVRRLELDLQDAVKICSAPSSEYAIHNHNKRHVY